jgi:hypothetical protein
LKRHRNQLLFAFIGYVPITFAFGVLAEKLFHTDKPVFVFAISWMLLLSIAGDRHSMPLVRDAGNDSSHMAVSQQLRSPMRSSQTFKLSPIQLKGTCHWTVLGGMSGNANKSGVDPDLLTLALGWEWDRMLLGETPQRE